MIELYAFKIDQNHSAYCVSQICIWLKKFMIVSGNLGIKERKNKAKDVNYLISHKLALIINDYNIKMNFFFISNLIF